MFSNDHAKHTCPDTVATSQLNVRQTDRCELTQPPNKDDHKHCREARKYTH